MFKDNIVEVSLYKMSRNFSSEEGRGGYQQLPPSGNFLEIC